MRSTLIFVMSTFLAGGTAFAQNAPQTADPTNNPAVNSARDYKLARTYRVRLFGSNQSSDLIHISASCAYPTRRSFPHAAFFPLRQRHAPSAERRAAGTVQVAVQPEGNLVRTLPPNKPKAV